MQNTCRLRYGVEYASQSPEFKAKAKRTNIERYGTEYWMQRPDLRKSTQKRYHYDGLKFDSKPEVALYIYLKDNKLDFEYQPNISFSFVYNGKTHRYFPDFKIGDKLVEIKGDHFFDADGTMKCPFRYKKWTDIDKENIDAIYESKHRCMIENGVQILRSTDYKKYVLYVNEMYGKDFLRKLKRY